MNKLYSLLSLCLGIVLLSACSTFKRIDLPKGNSAGYSSFRLYQHKSKHVPDFTNREDRVNAYLQAALKEEFEAHGLKESEQDAELIVAFLLIVQDTAVSTAISDYYITSGSDILSEAHRRMGKKNLPGGYEAGAIVVDIIDKKSGEVIYRDFAKREVLDNLTPAEKEQRAKDAAVEAVATFFRK
ncbi:MAG: hypothetical protein ABS34_00460 [Opitutaceae bacterium BACL24 MAG-120322-bin51]|jgi:hypothetical protein|nr:MAG: hypothetical protein ABS34_00460 [Opitutaceae bacterium BACL24 MAG-120322-bin51]